MSIDALMYIDLCMFKIIVQYKVVDDAYEAFLDY